MNNYCELEECLALKELGFKERVFHHFEDGVEKLYLVNKLGWDFNSSFSDFCSRPTYEEAFKFVEDKYNLYVEILIDMTFEPKFCYSINLYDEYGWEFINSVSDLFYTREEAKKECLKELIQVIKGTR